MDIMAVNARDEEQQYGNNHLGLGLSLSLGLGLGVATAAPVEVEPPPPPRQQQQRAISVAPITSLPAPQWWKWNGPGLFVGE